MATEQKILVVLKWRCPECGFVSYEMIPSKTENVGARICDCGTKMNQHVCSFPHEQSNKD